MRKLFDTGSLTKYFDDGESWENEVFSSMRQSRNRAWLLAFFCMAVTILSLMTLLFLLPLKTFEPYVVTVDKGTGYLEVTKGLAGGQITPDDAITQSNLVRYITARESYNSSILRQNYDFVALMSDGSALKEYQQLWNGKNPDNPSVRFGQKASIDIKIESVAFLTPKIASVRFLRVLHEDDQMKTSSWNAIINFEYVQKPMKISDRFFRSSWLSSR